MFIIKSESLKADFLSGSCYRFEELGVERRATDDGKTYSDVSTVTLRRYSYGMVTGRDVDLNDKLYCHSIFSCPWLRDVTVAAGSR